MQRALRMVMPVVAAALAVMAAINGVQAIQDGRIGGAVFKLVQVLIWLFVGYMLYDTGKRIEPGKG